MPTYLQYNGSTLTYTLGIDLATCAPCTTATVNCSSMSSTYTVFFPVISTLGTCGGVDCSPPEASTTFTLNTDCHWIPSGDDICANGYLLASFLSEMGVKNGSFNGGISGCKVGPSCMYWYVALVYYLSPGLPFTALYYKKRYIPGSTPAGEYSLDFATSSFGLGTCQTCSGYDFDLLIQVG